MSATTTSKQIDWMGGDTPSDWDVFKLKYILKEEKKSIGGIAPAGAISYGEVVFKEFDNDETLATYRSVKPGQFLINPLNLNFDLKSLRIGLSTIECRVSPAYIVATNDEMLTSAAYLRWALRVFDVQHIKTLGAGVRQTVGFDDIGDCSIALPHKSEQEMIASHLDLATTRIDVLVSKKTRFIELLREKRQAMITHAVTKGLDRGVPMKDSGVEWLGEVPAHWDVVQSRRLFSERNEKARPDDQQLTASQKYGLLPQAEFMEREGRRIVGVQKGHDILKRTLPGDFVISMRSFQGGLELSEYEGSVSSAYVPITPIKWVVPAYFRWAFKSITYIQALQATSDLVRDGQALRFENFTKVPLPHVPVDEQIAIADFLDRATTRIDTLVAKTERSIELLREHRTALITAAVTGKIDLRPAA